MQDVVIVCEDLFGLEIYSILEQVNRYGIAVGSGPVYRIAGFIWKDNAMPFGQMQTPAPIICSMEDWRPAGEEKVVLGILSPKGKAEAVSSLSKHDAEFETIVVPWFRKNGMKADIGTGCIFWPYSIKGRLAIGDYVTLISCLLTGHKIDDYSTVMRFSNIAGNEVGKGSYIGNHVFLPVGKKVGDYCNVSDGSLLARNVKSGTFVSGVPATREKRK